MPKWLSADCPKKLATVAIATKDKRSHEDGALFGDTKLMPSSPKTDVARLRHLTQEIAR
jgi:hypothetical protein